MTHPGGIARRGYPVNTSLLKPFIRLLFYKFTTSPPLLFTASHASVEEEAVAPGTRPGAAGVAALGGVGGQGGGDGGDESAGWAVDTDEDEDEGSEGWEEVELPERNEDIDPEVGML